MIPDSKTDLALGESPRGVNGMITSGSWVAHISILTNQFEISQNGGKIKTVKIDGGYR